MKKYTKKQLTRLRIALIFESKRRTKYIVKHHIFKEVGDKFFYQPRMIPSDPELIKIHNNVTIASGVNLITHDIIDNVLNNLGKGWFNYNSGCIEIMDNVFIGANSTIMPNVKIGPNAIIAAGSIVTKDVLPNTIVAGSPAKVVGKFDDYVEKRKKVKELNDEELWKEFYNSRVED